MKKLLYCLLGLVLLICIIDACLDFFYFAGPGKDKITQILSQKLNARVQIDQVKFRFLTGFTLRHFTVQEENANPFLEIKKISARPNYRELLSRNLVFDSLKINTPSLNLNQIADPQKYISIPISASASTAKKSFKLKIKKFLIKQGSAKWRNYNFQSLSAAVDIENKESITGSFSGLLDTQAKPPALFELNINYLPKTFSFSVNGNSSFFPIDILEPIFQKKLTDLKGLAGKTNIHFEIDGSIKNKINIHTTFTTPSLQLAFTPWQWEGPIQITANTTYFPLKNEWNYKGEMDIKNGNLSSSLLPESIKNVQGKLLFENNFLITNGIEGYFSGKSVRIRGSLEMDSMEIHTTLFTDLEPEEFAEIAKIIRPGFFKNISIKGKSFTKMQLNTDERTRDLEWSVSTYLKEASMHLNRPKLNYSDVNGAIHFNKNKIFFESLKGNLIFGKKNQIRSKADLHGDWSFKGVDSVLKLNLTEGSINSEWLHNPITDFNSDIFISPNKIDISPFSGKAYSDTFQGKASIQFNKGEEQDVSFYLSSPNYSLLFQGLLQDSKILINKLSGYSFGTTFDISGSASTRLSENWHLNLKTKIDTIALKKAWPILWEKANWLEIWKPVGTFDMDGFFNGIPNDSSTWHAKAFIKSKRFEIKNLYFDEFQMDYHLNNKIAKYHNIYGRLKDGTLEANLSFDHNQNPSEYSLDLIAKQIDIINIPKFFEKDTENFSLQGLFDGKILLKGQSGQPQSVIGYSNLSLSEGKLWDSPLLKPVWITIKNFVPSVEKPVFNSVEGDFKIGNALLKTDNLKLTSPGLILNAEGTIGFDQSMDMLFKIKFLDSKGSPFRKLAAKSLNLFGRLLEIEYKGSLDNPEINRRWLPFVKAN